MGLKDTLPYLSLEMFLFLLLFSFNLVGNRLRPSRKTMSQNPKTRQKRNSNLLKALSSFLRSIVPGRLRVRPRVEEVMARVLEPVPRRPTSASSSIFWERGWYPSRLDLSGMNLSKRWWLSGCGDMRCVIEVKARTSSGCACRLNRVWAKIVTFKGLMAIKYNGAEGWPGKLQSF